MKKRKSTKTDKSSIKFREEALKELHAPEELDKLIQVVPDQAWVWLTGIYILIASLVIWGIFGSIPTRVEGQGVLLAENGMVYNAVAPPGGGVVANILVKQGDIIKKNDIIAYLQRPDLVQKLSLENDYFDKLKKEEQILIQTAERELSERTKSVKEQLDKLNESLTNENANLAEIKKLLALKEEYFKKGYVVLQDIENTRRDFYSAQDRVEQIKIQIQQIQNQEDDFKEQWRRQLKDKELSILTEQLKVQNLQSELNISKAVLSPVEGVVISINTSIGKMVSDGGSIATLTSLGEGLDALVFMIPHEGERVSPGMKALVTPTTIEKEEYGSMEGSVISVSTFPESGETIVALLHNTELAKQYVEKGSPTGIRIRIERDAKTFSGYKWSSSQGPDKNIYPGILADARVTVKKQPPISLIIPAFKKLLGVS